MCHKCDALLPAIGGPSPLERSGSISRLIPMEVKSVAVHWSSTAQTSQETQRYKDQADHFRSLTDES